MYSLLVFLIYTAHLGAMTVDHGHFDEIAKEAAKNELLEEFAYILAGTFDNIDQVDCEESFGITPSAHQHTSLFLIKHHSLFNPDLPNEPTTYHFIEQFLQKDPNQVIRRRIYESTVTEIDGRNVVLLKVYKISDEER